MAALGQTGKLDKFNYQRLFIGHYLILFASVICFFSISCTSDVAPNVSYFRDGKFLNQPAAAEKKTLAGYLIMRMKTSAAEWPDRVEMKGGQILPSPRVSEGVTFYYINHSTFLIQMDGVNILTDPVLSERTSPVTWAGPERVTAPGYSIKQLPKIDVILISHDHYDHLDTKTIAQLHERDRPQIYLGLKAGRVFQGESYKEMKWWEETSFQNLRFVFTPAQHFSGRGLFDRDSTLWGSFIILGKKKTLYFGGDTGYGPHFQKIASRFPQIDIALLPIGAYAPREFMKFRHMDPNDAMKAHGDLRTKYSIGIHWGTFQLTNESYWEPKERLDALNNPRFLTPQNGACLHYQQKDLRKCKN